MVVRGRGLGERGTREQHEELAEMRREIEDLSRVVQALLRRGRARAHREVPEGNSEPFDIPEGSQEDECDEERKENLFHDACYANMDSVAVEDSSVDWETQPIYDEYEEDDEDSTFEDVKGFSSSETLPCLNEVTNECSEKLFDEHNELRIHFLEEAGFSTCETVESLCVHPVKPLTFYADPFLLESHASYLSNKEAFCLFSSTLFLTLESFKTEVQKNTPTGILKGETYQRMNAKSERCQNSEAERIIRHGKIRGRIFSNRRSMMQCDPTYIFVLNRFLSINHWIPIFYSMEGLLDDAGACYLAVK